MRQKAEPQLAAAPCAKAAATAAAAAMTVFFMIPFPTKTTGTRRFTRHAWDAMRQERTGGARLGGGRGENRWSGLAIRASTTTTACDAGGGCADTTTGTTKSAAAMHSGQWKSSPGCVGEPGCCTPACVQMKTGTSGARGRAAETSGHSDANATANAAMRAKKRRRITAGILPARTPSAAFHSLPPGAGRVVGGAHLRGHGAADHVQHRPVVGLDGGAQYLAVLRQELRVVGRGAVVIDVIGQALCVAMALVGARGKHALVVFPARIAVIARKERPRLHEGALLHGLVVADAKREVVP